MIIVLLLILGSCVCSRGGWGKLGGLLRRPSSWTAMSIWPIIICSCLAAMPSGCRNDEETRTKKTKTKPEDKS